MDEHVYKTIEITGSSESSIEEAVGVAVARARQSLHNLRWFEVNNIRGHVDSDKVKYWQVTIKLGMTLDS